MRRDLGKPMKPEIHPHYKELEVICSCGNTFTTRSTIKNDTLRVDVCSECHPFYTGKHKVVDTGGRIQSFMAKYGKKTESGKNTDS